MFAPKFPNPDPPPAPELKNPDDGVDVVFPKPGVGGILISGMFPGMTYSSPSALAGISGQVIAGMVVPSVPTVTSRFASDALGNVRPPGKIVIASMPPGTAKPRGIWLMESAGVAKASVVKDPTTAIGPVVPPLDSTTLPFGNKSPAVKVRPNAHQVGGSGAALHRMNGSSDSSPTVVISSIKRAIPMGMAGMVTDGRSTGPRVTLPKTDGLIAGISICGMVNEPIAAFPVRCRLTAGTGMGGMTTGPKPPSKWASMMVIRGTSRL